MRFQAEHQFAGSADAVIGILTDPEFHQQLQLPDLALPEVLDSTTDGDKTVLRLRYRYEGQLDSIAKRLLGDRKLTWLQELRVDRASRSGRLAFGAEADPKRLYGSADFTLKPQDGNTTRRLQGELVVSVPMVGGTAERRIVPGLISRLDVEAQAVESRLQEG